MRCVGLLFFGIVLAAPAAVADVTPPPGDCAHKKPGEACKDEAGRPGACGDVSYTRTWTPPTPGATPQTSQSSYFGCKAGATPTAEGDKKSKMCSLSAVGMPTSGAWTALVLALGWGVRWRQRRWRAVANGA